MQGMLSEADPLTIRTITENHKKIIPTASRFFRSQVFVPLCLVLKFCRENLDIIRKLVCVEYSY